MSAQSCAAVQFRAPLSSTLTEKKSRNWWLFFRRYLFRTPTDYRATSTRTFCVFTCKLSCTLPLSAAHLSVTLMTTVGIPSCFSDLAYNPNSVTSNVMSFRAPNSNFWGKCNTTYGRFPTHILSNLLTEKINFGFLYPHRVIENWHF